jgi:hypothetical protein
MSPETALDITTVNASASIDATLDDKILNGVQHRDGALEITLSEPELDGHSSSSSSSASGDEPTTEGSTFQVRPIDYNTPGVVDPDQFSDEHQILANPELSDEMKRAKISRILARAASNGDDARVRELLEDERIRSWIDPDAQDEDGTTPLIYAACFGHLEVAKALLRAGANVDAQDQCKC